MATSNLPNAAELRQVLDCAGRLAEVYRVEDFYVHATAVVAGLIPGAFPSCELIGLDPPGYLGGHTAYPLPDHLYQRIGELMPEHPLMNAFVRCGAHGLIWSGPRSAGGTPLRDPRVYDEVYAHVGIEYLVIPSVKLDPSRSLTLVFSSDRPIPARQRRLLDLVRPHLAAAFRNWEALHHHRRRAHPTPQDLAHRFALPPRRAEVLWHIAQGRTNPQIAAALDLRVPTVRKHVELLLLDLDVDNRFEAALRVHRG